MQSAMHSETQLLVTYSMPSLKKLADEQLEMAQRAKEDGHSRVKAALEKNNVKGLRGTLDLEEMAQLVRS